MKKRISIFTFLLGTFTAGLAFEAGANQTVYGGYHYIGETYQSPRSADRMAVKDSKPAAITKSGLPKNETVVWEAYEPGGMKITKWGAFESSSSMTIITDAQKYSKYNWKDDGSTEFTWKNANDVTYAAIAVRFDYIKYTLKFASSQGGTMPEDLETTYEKPVAIPAPSSVPTGYHFVKWIATSSFDEEYRGEFAAGVAASGEDFGLAGCHTDGSVITLTAQWATNAYSVSCELNGGSWPADYEPPANAVYDEAFSLPAPTRIGYDFIGWKVTSGLNTTTAKWGTGENPSMSITADTLCANGKNEVYFKNLNPTDKTTVTLTAQWQAATITVTFNNHGGSSGGGMQDILPVTYNATYSAVNVPTKGGSLFRGYEIDGTPYWDDQGQATKTAWDIPTNCTAHAQWEVVAYQLTYDENRSDGTASKTVVRDFEYGKPTKLYDGADFSNLGCTLLGWSTNKQAEKPDDGCEIGASKTFVESKTLYAVWEKNYFIAFDGNGATNETPMAVQKIVFGKSGQSLNPNVYGKVGYTFLGWATNRVAALELDWKYADRQVLQEDLAKTLGETNTLYATWDTNTYYVAFDWNGGSSPAIGIKTCKYDQPVTLPWGEYTFGAYDFVGWSNDVAKVIYADSAKPVSNLCAIADGTNKLYAVWKLSPLSAAMHCDNLRWESYAYETNYAKYVNEWFPEPSGEGVSQTGGAITKQQWLVTQVPTNGTLSFKWMPVGCEGQSYSLSYWITADKDNYFQGIVDLDGEDGEWHTCVISNVPSQYYVHLYVGSNSTRSYCQVDQMTWTPDGSEPVDGKDNVTISSAAVSDGKFVLSFTSDAKFDYNLLTNADLLGGSWGVMGEKKIGNGNILTFEPEIIEGQPQLFYMVETIQKK